jgi:hypothetical protein
MLSEQRRRRIEGLLADLGWARMTSPARDHRWVAQVGEDRVWVCAVCSVLTRDRYLVEVTCAELQAMRAEAEDRCERTAATREANRLAADQSDLAAGL